MMLLKGLEEQLFWGGIENKAVIDHHISLCQENAVILFAPFTLNFSKLRASGIDMQKYVLLEKKLYY